MHPNDIIPFIRQKDYVFVKELGEGACGKTVLLRDEIVDQYYVCKKYHPNQGLNRQKLFKNFVREVQLLHRVHHPNVVRVFNHFLFPDKCAGYLLMEYVDGCPIDEYMGKSPEKANEIFIQAVDGFAHLESNGILHRDIRPQNIMVSSEGFVKVIDLGFGKHVETASDFDKSVSLNWWCTTPQEFSSGRYDFCSEVYFLGKLFEKILHDYEVEHFKYRETLERMCHAEPHSRVPSFDVAQKEVQGNRFLEIDFDEWETRYYRNFSDNLTRHVASIQNDARFISDVQRIQKRLEDAYRSFMLEEVVPDPSDVVNCFIDGAYKYFPKVTIRVDAVKGFVHLLKAVGPEKRNVIIANLRSRLASRPSHTAPAPEDDIPF